MRNIEKPTRGAQSQETRKTTKCANTDSGSGKRRKQGDRGSGPLVLTTQGCTGTRPKNNTKKKNRAHQ